jgi:phage terminase large subunit-like protein
MTTTTRKKPRAHRVRRSAPIAHRPSPLASEADAHPRSARVHAYARAVVAGEIVAGRYVRLACRRHLDDLARSGFDDHGRRLPITHNPSPITPPLIWTPAKAESILTFAEDVVRLEDDKPLVLDDWQAFILGSLFGWYRSDGYRRFRIAYIEIGKGNGKTPLAAVVGLYGLTLDDEHAPEIYSAAVAKDQAAICFRDAVMAVESSPHLRSRVQVQVGSLTVPARYGVFRPLSSEQKNLDGKRVHIGIIDELHEHPDDKVSAKIRAGTKRRRNALVLEITNSGYGRTSVCRRHHETSLKIIEGIAVNDAWFAYVCTLDPCPACVEKGLDQPDPKCPACDDWRSPAVWKKANPGLDTILPSSYLREQVDIATTVTSEENLIKRLNFCLWTEQAVRWINLQKWDACGRRFGPCSDRASLLAYLRGRPCRLGLDASTTGDFSAAVLVFELPDGYYAVLPLLFLPEGNLQERVDSTGIRFDTWAEQGHIFLTPGDLVDYDVIRARIVELGRLYAITEIAFDPYNVSQLTTQLAGDGFKCVPVRQGFLTLNAPSKEFEKVILREKFLHLDHPVLRWMASNVAISHDPAGNIKPDKEKSTEKIDGIVATIMALDRWIRKEPEPTGDAWAAFV